MGQVNYLIRAQVVDIGSDQPRPSDSFLVDTNVWYWLTYPRLQMEGEFKPYKMEPKRYQMKYYPSYLKQARGVRAKLFTCALCFSELADLIEKSELDIFLQTKGQIAPKEFRHNEPAERVNVVSQIHESWAMVRSMAEFIDIMLDEDFLNKTLQDLQSVLAGAQDLFMVQTALSAGISQVITDDGDFATIPDLVVFTANRNVIQAANQQGKLLIRP